MTIQELKNYENELYILRSDILSISKKGSFISKSDIKILQSKTKRIAQIKKILLKAKKDSLRRGN